MIEIFLKKEEDPDKPELPVMTEWSSKVIDAVVAGRDISCLTPYRKWKEGNDEEKREGSY